MVSNRTCFRRAACTHADPSARLLPRESYKLVDPASKGFVHYRLLSHAEPMAYYIFIFQGGKDHMKKNLRIVSAAAALLAVAPVAASAAKPSVP